MYYSSLATTDADLHVPGSAGESSIEHVESTYMYMEEECNAAIQLRSCDFGGNSHEVDCSN